MDPERWEKVAHIYGLACEHEGVERDSVLAAACEGDEELQSEVESLLRHDVSLAGPLERAAEVAGKAWPIPDRIGRYRILSLLGEGGMGTVYEAEQDHPHRIVALKVLKSALAGPDLVRRFCQESEALGRLQHPGIARIYEAGTGETGLAARPYFAMEFIRGVSLLEYAQSRQLNLRQRLESMVKVCEAADHAHQRGIIHRDLKPANILVDETGQPKILDFGVARIADTDSDGTRQTSFGDLVGTLSYMSPEQLLADPAIVDARSDVYSLGVVMYELLSGRLPYHLSRQLPEAARIVREQDPAPLDVPPDLEILVRKALEKDKDRRYESAAEFADDLRRYLTDRPILARPPTRVYQARKFMARHKALASGVAVIFLILLAATGVSTLQAIRARRAEQISNAVNDFLQNDLLAQAGARAQAGAHGQLDPDLKVRTALDRAAERVAVRFGSQPSVEAAIRRSIGLAYYNLNLYGKAEPQLERAVDIRKRVLGPEHPDTLTSAEDLGVLYLLEGKFPAAEALLANVVEVRQRTLGKDHRDTLAAMGDWGTVISYQGDDALAEPIFVKLLESERRVLGEQHPDTLSVMDNLATVYLRLGKYTQAEALLEKELELSRRVLGPQHPDIPNCMHNLANVYRYQGKYAKAEAMFADALSARQRALGEEHHETQNTRMCLGVCYRAQGRLAEARSLLTQALEGFRRMVGPENPLTLRAMHYLGELARSEGRLAEAESLFDQVLTIRRRVLSPDNPYTAQVLESLGDLKLEQHAFADAERLAREAVQIRQRKSSNAWQRYWAETMLGASLDGLGRYDEGKPLLASGYQGMLERQGSIPAESRSVLDRTRTWVAATGLLPTVSTH